MNKVLTFSILFLIVVSGTYAAHHTPELSPEFEETHLNFQGRFAVLPDLGVFDPYLEVQGSVDDAFDLDSFSLILGGYYRLHKNIKIGGFYQLEAGALHDDDWIFTDSTWKWEDTTGRFEHSLIFDATPRILLPGILKESTVASLKVRYSYNFFNGHQKILTKPGINFFYIVDRKPILSAGIYYSLYFPLNFSTAFIYEQGPYVSVLYHLNKKIKIEARASYLAKTWTEGKDSIALGDSYSEDEKSLNIGLGLVFKL